MRSFIPFALGFVLLFWPTFGWMAERFEAADSFYSHGWLIPLASLWLIWRKRQALREIPRTPSFKGLWLLVPSVLVHLVATHWRIGFVSGFAMVVAVWGLVWTLWGGPALRHLRFPLAFLLFMVPLPGILLIHTSFKMKLMAAGWAVQVIPFFGIPAVQAGSTIHLPGLTVVVDDTCSGLRSLISLIALAVLWTALLPEMARRWQRWTLVAASIPIAISTNMVRIVGTVLLARVYGPGVAEGFVHYGSGALVFGMALAVLLALSQWVQRWSSPSYASPR